MLAVLLLLSCLFVNSVTSTLRTKFDYFHHPVKSCHIGDVVQNECNRCLCTSKTIFECIPIDCDKTKIKESKLTTTQVCIPNQLYVQNLITCICTKDGKWPHKSCEETFLSLPPTSIVQHKCDANSYVHIDCNICRCGPDGEFIANRCTKNTCEDDISRRNHKNADKKSSVYSNCEKKTWYSLAPCQFCYCVNENKLVCNTGNDHSQKLELGTYDMQVCGVKMIQEALELVPDNQNNLRDSLVNTDTPTETTKPPVRETTTTKIISKKRYTKVKSEKKATVASKQINSETGKSLKSAPEVIDNEAFYTDLEDKIITTNAPVVQPPEDNVLMAPVSGEEPINSKSVEDNSNGLDVEVEQLVIPPKVDAKRSSRPHKKALRRAKVEKTRTKADDTIDMDLPEMFNKVFSMTLRKSMVSIDKDSQCTPGTTTMHGCNTCFCLKNGKLLCSSRNC